MRGQNAPVLGTNDKGELVSANTIVFEVAQQCRQTAKGLAARVLDVFLREYDREAIARIRTAYLCCFSTVRDDESQWRRYGDDGKGVCLGFRIINEPGPENPQTFSRMFEVVYSEDSLRKSLFETFGRTCAALAKYPITAQNIRFALATIRGFAAFAAITTRTPDWSSEHEVRHVTMDRFEPGVTANVRVSADGKEIRYLPVTLRANAKLMALDEIIIGAKQDFGSVRKQFETLLASKGYAEGMIEYPRFNVSSVCQAEQAIATVPP